MRRAIVIAVVAIVLVACGSVYYALDPSASPLFPRCTFLSLTGYKCPGCGSQRAIHSLLHGDVAAALGYNALLVIALPLVAVYVLAEACRKRAAVLYARLNAPLAIWVLLVAVLAWWALRNVFDW